ncbi:MAG: hypothetical protein ACE5GV_01355 [Candidatus Scalindua sp.]
MIIYCDRLAIGACIRAVQLCWRKLFVRPEACCIKVLDPLSDHGWPALLRVIMQCIGFQIDEIKFSIGHLRMPDGQAVYTVARSLSIDLAFRAAERIIMCSRYMGQINLEYGSNTILMHVAKSLEFPALQLALRIVAAKALVRGENDNNVCLVIQRLSSFPPNLVRKINPDFNINFYRSGIYQFSGVSFYSSGSFELLKYNRFSVLFFLLFSKLIETGWTLKEFFRRSSSSQELFNVSEISLPSLLLLQEDDISLDRSYRTQPHWLFKEDGKPPFRTIIIQKGSMGRMTVNIESLREKGITLISKKNMYLLTRRYRSSHPVQNSLHKFMRKCVLLSIFGSSTEVGVAFMVANLLYSANCLAFFCKRSNVRAFMTCENYMKEADAMQIIALALGITTVSYQYSNMGRIGPLMKTTADVMLTFSSLYHQLWIKNSIAPKKFVNIGYTFDTSFRSVSERASAHRSQLIDSGVEFIICYFDENHSNNKYHLINEQGHCSELLALLRFVLDDKSLGLVVKTQFQRNSPQNLEAIADVYSATKATGRYLELDYGCHRNIVFPAEASLVADITIGHAVGATASLEAALTGVRSIILNPYGIKGENDALYDQTDIVYPSMATALKAIRSFRSNPSDHTGLGDWSKIIDQFDPFRDGNAGHRMRSFLEKIVLRDS